MRLLTLVLSLALTFGVSFTRADEVSDEERCVEAIFEAYTHLSFTGSRSQPFLVDSCSNPLRTWSIYASVKVFCDPREIHPGLRHINEPCRKGGLSRPPYADIAPSLTEEYIRSLRVVDYAEVPKNVELDTAILISRAYYDTAFRTNAAWSLSSRMHRAYGAASYYFWGGVLLVGIINHILTTLFHLHRIRQNEDPHWSLKHLTYVWYIPGNLIFESFTMIHHWIRTNLIIPATIGSYHQRLYYYCSVPTRMEAIPIIAFYLLSFAFMALSYDIFEGNLYWPDPSQQFWRYLSDRTGLLAYANLCLLWLFGGRNNPFLWATGWKFSTFNLFHRAIARVATIQAVVHSAGYTILVMRKNTYALYSSSPWWYMGIAATVCMSLLLLFSSIYLRKNFYELFLLIHITFSVIIVVGLFIHTAIFSGKYDIYLWPVVLVWSLDRLARIVRVMYYNIHISYYMGARGSLLSLTKGRLSYSNLSDILWLEITIPSNKLEPRPGQYYYIYQPIRWRGYENHPFTLGGWTVIDGDSDMDNTLPSPSAAAATVPTAPGQRRKLIFWIRPFDGWTRRLRNDCLRSPTLCVENSMFLIEGPYGQVSPLHTYERVILIAGGSGIAGVLPYVQERLRRCVSSSSSRWGSDDEDSEGEEQLVPSSSSPLSAPSTTLLSSSSPGSKPGIYKSRRRRDTNTRTRDVTLIWTARQREFIEEIFCEHQHHGHGHGHGMSASILKQGDFHVRLYATSGDKAKNNDKEQGRGTLAALFPTPSSPTEQTSLAQDFARCSDDFVSTSCACLDDIIAFGRPDIQGLISDLVKETALPGPGNDNNENHKGERIAVLISGPGGMADDARHAVHRLLKEGYRVDYFEEAFGW